MDGITKVIDELGSIIIEKNVELKNHKKEIERLKQKIGIIEQCLEIYEDCYKNTINASNIKSNM